MIATLQRPGLWRSSGFGVTGLDMEAGIASLRRRLPALDPRDGEELLRAAEFGRLAGDGQRRAAPDGDA